MPDKKISKHSKSFAWLFGTALVGTILAVLVMRQFEYPSYFTEDADQYQTVTYLPKAQGAVDIEPAITVDSSNWLQYSNLKYGLNFKYSPDWKIRSVEKNKDGYYVIEIDPGARYDNFRIYISEDDYFALSGVPITKTQIGGKEAISLDGAVLGIKDNATYYTFDMGASLSLKPYFQALIETVSFSQ